MATDDELQRTKRVLAELMGAVTMDRHLGTKATLRRYRQALDAAIEIIAPTQRPDDPARTT